MSAILTVSDRVRLARYLISQGALNSLRWIRFNPFLRWRLAGPVSPELLIAPQDITTADATRANDIYAGYFSFNGHMVNCSGSSPFDMQGPPLIWHCRLHEFGWLKHLRAAENAVSRAQARLFVEDWIRQNSAVRGIAWDVECTAKRVIAWLSHSPLMLEGCDHAFYRRFMRSLTRQVRYLRLSARDTPQGLPRLLVAIALAYAAFCMAGPSIFVRNSVRRLDRELQLQILPDGGHVSRNPAAIITLLSLLLPLRQTIIARDVAPGEILIGAINRMMPMLRFFRLGDGSFGRFNGMGDTPGDLVATLLAYDDAGGSPVLNATHSGYQRLSADDIVVLMDTGALPPRAVCSHMHAGCLSFEMSAGLERIVVNCGHLDEYLASNEAVRLARIARSTAAHSTLSINEQSSARFTAPRWSRPSSSVAQILSGPQKVVVSRLPSTDEVSVDALHDGYLSAFGLKHRRILTLSSDGMFVSGQDIVLTQRDGQVGPDNDNMFQIRFHLHPNVAATQSSARTVEIALKSGKRFLFNCMNIDVTLDDTVTFSQIYGTQRAQQIVIEGRLGDHSVVDWAFQRLY